MSNAIVDASGRLRQLDRSPEPDEQVTEEQVQDAPRLARLLMSILRDVARLRRSWRPRVIDHHGVEVAGDGSTVYRLAHGFGRSSVNWWVIDYAGADGPGPTRDASSDANTLCLVTHAAGTISIRIEERA